MSYQEQTTANQGSGIRENLSTGTILATAQKEPGIRRFMDGVRAAGMEEQLNMADLRTFFAPADEGLGREWDELSQPENRERLRQAIARHIVIGRQTLADLRTATSLRTVFGDHVQIAVKDGDPKFGGATIIRRDIACVNGQIQIVDRPAT